MAGASIPRGTKNLVESGDDRSPLYTLDSHGDPVPCDDFQQWDAWIERSMRDRSWVIAEDCDERDPEHTVSVSTIFTGLDHNYGDDGWETDDGPPVLWETMVFGGVLDGEQRRYSSRADALRGHQALCARVNATIPRTKETS
jgi:hypothetical protein